MPPRRRPGIPVVTARERARIRATRDAALRTLAAGVVRDVAARRAAAVAAAGPARPLRFDPVPPPRLPLRFDPVPPPRLPARPREARVARRLRPEPALFPGGRAITRQRAPGRPIRATPANIGFAINTVRTRAGFVQTTYTAVNRNNPRQRLVLPREQLFQYVRQFLQRQAPGANAYATFTFTSPEAVQFRGISGASLTAGTEAAARQRFFQRLGQFEREDGPGGSVPVELSGTGELPQLNQSSFAIVRTATGADRALRLPLGPRVGATGGGGHAAVGRSLGMDGRLDGPVLIPTLPQEGGITRFGCVAAVGEAWGLAGVDPESGELAPFFAPFPEEATPDGFVPIDAGLSWLRASLERAMEASGGGPWVMGVLAQNVIGQEGIHGDLVRGRVFGDANIPRLLAGAVWHKGHLYRPVFPWHVAMLGSDVEDPARVFIAVVDREKEHIAAAAGVVAVDPEVGGGWGPAVSELAFHGPRSRVYVLTSHGRVRREDAGSGGGGEEFAARPAFLKDIGQVVDVAQLAVVGEKALVARQPELKKASMVPPRWVFREWATPKQMWEAVTPPETAITVYYDFETVYGRDGLLVPYAVAYLVVKATELDAESLDAESLPGRARVLVGFDCGRRLMKVVAELIHSGEYASIELAGFNSARFDAFFLMQASDELQEVRGAGGGGSWSHGPAARDAFYNGAGHGGQQDEIGLAQSMGGHFFTRGALLSAEIRGWGMFGINPHCRATLFDLAKHLPGASLANLAKSFNTPHKKVEGFDHAQVQAMYDADPGFLWTNDDFVLRLSTYNRYDVVVLAELHHAYLRALHRLIPETMARLKEEKPNGRSLPLTLGSLTRQHWEWSIGPKLGTLPWGPGERELCTVSGGWEPFRAEEYMALRTSLVGGRCQLPNGPLEVREPTEELDCTSMYPFVSAAYAVRYPVGSMRAVARPTDLDAADGPLGIYRVDVDQGPLLDAGRVGLVARKEWSPSGAMLRNNWGERHVYNTWVTTPILRLLLECGARVVHRGGFEWSHSLKSIELFECLLSFMAEKNRMDVAKATGDTAEYNPALRNLCKLMMNALYGQMLRGIFERTVKSITAAEFEKLLSDVEAGKLKRINCIKMIHRTVFADVVHNTEDRIDKQSPNILGYFILGYAREYMSRHLWLQIPRPLLLYMDTDCARATRETFNHYVIPYLKEQAIPAWPEVQAFDANYRDARMYGNGFSIFGAFTPGAPHDNTGAVFASKKLYCIIGPGDTVAREGERGPPAVGMKGIRKEDLIVSDATVEHVRASDDPFWRFETCKSMYFNDDGGGAVRVGEGAHVLLRRILAEGHAWVLSSSLNRITWNLLSGVGVDEPERQQVHFGRVRQVFTFKKLSVAAVTPDPSEARVVGLPAEHPDAEAAEHVSVYEARYDRQFVGGEEGDDAPPAAHTGGGGEEEGESLSVVEEAEVADNDFEFEFEFGAPCSSS